MANEEKQVTTPKDKSLEDLAVRYQTEIYMMGDKSKSKTKRETDLEKKLQSVLNKLSGTNVMGGKGRQRILSVIKQRAMSNYRDEMGTPSKEVEVPKSKPTAEGVSLFREIGSAVKNLFQKKNKEKKKKGINRGGAILKKNVEKMMYGGMANKKKHMYAAGGSVTDNAGLRALKKASPQAYANIKKGS
tara:strand:+ start:682 stop:1245 length:564 start_codon:yes stop_codon:yes gene_type:complete